MENILSADVLLSYPEVDMAKAEQLLQMEISRSGKKIVVLDDDPTGVQTVHHVSVYTDWTENSIRQGFEEEDHLFYILTNSRGLTAEQTAKVHREIAAAVKKVSEETGKEYLIMSRSDSTLRGHYPLETLILKEETEAYGDICIDGEIICPFFKEGGRFTLNNTHFGYTHSDICEYVEEKTNGVYKAEDVVCISLEDLRNMDLEKITGQLLAVKDFQKVVVNAIDDSDVKIMSIAVYRAMAAGKNFLFRTAAALVKEMGGISSQPLLTREKMIIKDTDHGGVVIVGSHTQKTTQQLEELKKAEGIVSISFNSDLVLDEEAFRAETERTTGEIERIITSGKTAVVYTKRKLLVVEHDTKKEALLRSVKISDAVQSLVGNLRVVPSFVIAKGGITSSDVGTKALKVKRAVVMGQIRPGVPVWQTGEESRFPLTPYVIFPGNVGDVNTLREAVEILMNR